MNQVEAKSSSRPRSRRPFPRWRKYMPAFAGIVALLLVALVHLRLLPFSETAERIERANLDLFFRLRGPISPEARIHVIALDDQSLQKFGAWPWPRQRLAELLERVLAAGPQLVVCDLLLPNKPEELAGTQALAKVVAASGQVVLPYYFSDLGKSAGAATLPEEIAASTYLLFDFPEKLLIDSPIEAAAVNYPAEALLRASRPGGHINIFPEEQFGESTVRWEAQIIRYGKSYLPSLPVQAAIHFLQLTRAQVQVKVGSGIQIGKNFVPTDQRGWTLINYYGATATFPQTSAATILEKDIHSGLNGKLIFIGVTAAGTQDVLQTPLASRMPGVEKLATSTSNILQQDALVRNSHIEFIEFAVLCLFGLLALLVALRLPKLYVGVALLGLVLIVWVGAFGFFSLGRLWIKSGGLIFAIIAAGGATAILRRYMKIDRLAGLSGKGEASVVVTDEQGKLLRLGRFEILGEIGAGAMGKIYEGFDPTINRRVAIKTIRSDIDAFGGERARQRFLREAQAAGALNHRNIVTIYQADEAGPYSFIAMEFLEGETLEKIIERQAPLPLEEICRLVTPICEALDYAHRHGVVHRDIKPSNIMITTEGVVKVMDFGIAHLDYSTLTREGAVLGTPSYMSPEQIRGENVDGQSDIFSLGVVVYEMATGQRPFLGESIATISHRILSNMPLLASDLNPNLSPALDAALWQAMAKDKANRFPTAKAFAEALAAVCTLKELDNARR
ncbi:MAG: serine/threonine-protein kinase [candidate division KSB1 bacterium]|nr:serine/threonine-protein kinase [candidate division KSB1 bacterium]